MTKRSIIVAGIFFLSANIFAPAAMASARSEGQECVIGYTQGGIGWVGHLSGKPEQKCQNLQLPGLGPDDPQQNDRLNNHDKDIADLDAKDKNQDGRLDGHDKDISDIEDKDKEQDGRLDGHDKDISDIHDKDREQDGRLDGHDKDISDILDKDREQDGRLDGHDKDISDIHNKDREQDGRLDGHDKDISDIHNKDREQDGRLDGHDKDIKNLNDHAVMYDVDAAGKSMNSITLVGDGTGSPVSISNVAAGVNTTDAVNKGQLDGVLTGLGGGAQVNPDGSIQGPTYNIGGNNYHNVGDAFAATNNRINNFQIQNNARFERLEGKISDIRKEARGGIAGANALAALRFDDRPGKASLAAGFGGFKNATAMAIAAGYTTIDGDFRLNAGVTHDFNGNNGVGWNAGMSWTFN